MNYSPNIPLEILRALLTIAGWYVLFYHRTYVSGQHVQGQNVQGPDTRRLSSAVKLRRIVLLVSFPVCYTAWKLNVVVGNSTINQTLWVVIILLFALLCGNLKESLFTAIYYIGMEACLDTLRNFIVHYSFGRAFPLYSPAYYVQMNLLYLVVLGWTIFYYLVLKNRREKLPLRFWIMMTISPLGSMMLLTYFADVAYPLQNELGVNIYLVGILMGLFLVTLNLLTFYMYVRLLVFYESHLQTKVLQGQLDAQTRRIIGIEAFQRQTDELRHEFKNMLFTLNIDMEQQNYEQVKQRTRQLLGDLKQAEPEHYTGISLIDAVISYKSVRLRELGANISVQADLLDLESSTCYDVASILGIALDNVTDACAIVSNERVHEAARTASVSVEAHASTETPWPVHYVIQRLKNVLLIQVTNPLPGPLLYKNGEIQSTKAETGHGLGLSALRRIVQKYDGEVTISDKEGIFSLSVMLFV
jgi:signal transduction histidine kinase